MGEKPAVTTLLGAVARGDPGAQGQLYELVYDELKRIARATLRRAGGHLTMNPSTLVHEAYLKLAGDSARDLNGSRHFYNLLARAMRQVILDLSRQHATSKHGAGMIRTQITDHLAGAAAPLEQLIEIDAALNQLATIDAELAELVEWHFFAGLSFAEIAAVRGVTDRTIRRHWDSARALLIDLMPGVTPAAG
jgi:RNA polymerase sigma factor (TIGR02999 family)